MTELEYVEALRQRVAERMCDTENWMGAWAHMREQDDKASLDVQRFWVRHADAALSLLAPMLAERDLPFAGRKWIEFCRACREERDEIVPAEFILWGKLLPPEQMGPRCCSHTADYIGPGMSQIDQWAVFDLRPFNRLLSAVEASGDGDHA